MKKLNKKLAKKITAHRLMIASTMQPSSPENRQVRERILCRTSIYQSISELKMCARRRQTDRQTASDRRRRVCGPRCPLRRPQCARILPHYAPTPQLHDIAAMFVTAAHDCLLRTRRLTTTDRAWFLFRLLPALYKSGLICGFRLVAIVRKFQHFETKM